MNEQIIKVLNNKYTVPAIVGVTSFVTGTGLGYFWGKRNGDVFIINQSALEDEGVEVVEEDELQEAILEQLYDEANREQAEELNEYFVPEVEQFVPEVHNVFAENDDQWVYEDELAIRTDHSPYVIHKDEYIADEAGCDQRTVTYYQDDDIMADESDTPIYDFNGLMGDLKWGHGSGDPSVVYIRNEKLEMEWEVLLHTGSFAVEVLGSDIEDAYASKDLKNSVQKFRDE